MNVSEQRHVLPLPSCLLPLPSPLYRPYTLLTFCAFCAFCGYHLTFRRSHLMRIKMPI